MRISTGLSRNKKTNVVNNEDQTQYRSYLEKRQAILKQEAFENEINILKLRVQTLETEIQEIKKRLDV